MFSKGQGPRPPGAPLGASPSSAPSPGPLGSVAASGLLGAAGAGFRLLWLLRREGSALAGVFLAAGGVGAAGGSCFSAWVSFFPGLAEGAFPSAAGGALASAVACGALVSGLGLLVAFPLDSMPGGAGRLRGVCVDRQAAGTQWLRTAHPWALSGPGERHNEAMAGDSARLLSSLPSWTTLHPEDPTQHVLPGLDLQPSPTTP